PIATTVLSHGPPIQYTCLPNQRVSESYSSSQRADTPSDERAVAPEHDKGDISETEFSDTNASETLWGSFYYKSLQDLTTIESDTPLMDSGSERCVIDSDSDLGVFSDSELEEPSRDFGSVLWGAHSDSEKSPRDSDSENLLLNAENYQITSVSVEDLTKTGQQLVSIEHCQVEYGSLKDWIPSGSEKYLEDSDSERDSDSDNERKKEEKRQMASDSIKRLIESEKTVMETENFYMIPDPESYAVYSDTEKSRASVSKVHLTQTEKTEKQRPKRYMMDSDSEPGEMDSDSERCQLASATEKCFMGIETFYLGTDSNKSPKGFWSERTVDSDLESPVMSSDSGKHRNLERLKVAHMSKSMQHWLDAERKQLESDHSGHWDSPGKYHFRSIVLQDSFGKCQGDVQTFQSITEKDQVDSSSEKHQKKTGNEQDQNEHESKRHPIKTKKGFDNEGFQMYKERRQFMESDRCDSENEAHRLGARRKDNRPPGFWRPVTLLPKLDQEEKTEEQKSVQQKDNRVCRTPLTRYKTEDKTVTFKEASSGLSDMHLSLEKMKKKQRYSFSPDSQTFTVEKYHRKARRKLSVYKRHCREYRFAHGRERSRYQISPVPLSSETCTSNVSSVVGSPNSESPKSVTRQKTRRSITYSLDVGTEKCTRCFMEISDSSFHKCPTNSDDSDSDCPLYGRISSDSKYSLSYKTVKYFKTSRNRPLSPSLDRKHHVGIRCSLHKEGSKYFVDSTSYLHCESCIALRNLQSSKIFTIPIKSKKNMGEHSNSDHIMSTPVTLSESESKFNLTAQPQNKDNPDDNIIKFIGTKSIKDEADVEDKLLSKDETDHEDETNTEDETDDEDETDTEDEDNNKDKKDPNDKFDPDGSDPKDGNSENNTDSNRRSDPSGASGPTSGPDCSNDDDSKNVNVHNESDPAINNASSSDINLKYSTYLDSVDLAEDFNQHNNATKGSTNPNAVSGSKNRTVMDYISGSNNDAVHRNDPGQGDNIYPENTGPIANSFDFIKNEADSNNPSPQNSHRLPKDLESNYTKHSNATSHKGVNPINISNPNYDTEPTSTAVHKHTAAIKYYSDPNDITGFTYKVRSSFLVNPNYFGRKKYVSRPSSLLNTTNAIDTSNITSCTSAISSQFTAGKNYAPENKHFPTFSHFNGFNIIIKNTQNAHNSTDTRNTNILIDNELKISSISSVLKIVYENISNFIAGTNHNSYLDFLITSEFYDSFALGRAYIIFDNQNIGAQFQNSAGYMDSDTSKYDTGSTDALDAKESGFLKEFSRVQNPIGIKDSSPFKIISNQNIPPPSFDCIVEAELPDAVKFAVSSGAVNQLFKLLDNYSSASRGEGGSLAVPMREIIRRSSEETTLQPAQRPPMRHEEEYLLGAAVGLTVKPAEGYDDETSKLTRQYTQSTSDDDPNESGSSIIMDFINCFMKVKAQNWIDLSWFKRHLPTFFSEEERRPVSKTRICAIACTDLGHGKCEGWLWHKRESRGISFFSWKKYWFILKHSTLYWFSHLNDTKADGFIYLPEFRIDLAPHCRRDQSFHDFSDK
ncbi:hypothetical protein STEG23_009059, partial [Scotinomys teguina]